jgi:hypothetical protein
MFPSCPKGGNYKICCDNKKDGRVCPHNFAGINNGGTSGSGCYVHYPDVMLFPEFSEDVESIYQYQNQATACILH